MSRVARPLDGDLDGAGRRSGGDDSSVDEELRFHIDLLVEQLCSEGYSPADAEVEARRRFGDPGAIAEECATQRWGPIGVALHWLTTSTAGAVLVFVAALVAVVATEDPPLALFCVLMPVALAAGACAALVALRPARSRLVLRAGHRLLGLLCLLSLATFLLGRGDWVHSLWSVQFPLSGLLFGSGLLLIRIWPADRAWHPEQLRGWNGATIALLGLLVLGSTTFLLGVTRTESAPAGAVDGSPFSTLLESAAFGLGGEVPGAMQPHGAWQAERGFGVPPRFVTVTMGSSLFAALTWIQFVLMALVGGAIQEVGKRRAFLLLSPLLLAPAWLLLLQARVVYTGVWRNEAWFVKSYGPTLLVAVAATAVLMLALHRARGSPSASVGNLPAPHPTGDATRAAPAARRPHPPKTPGSDR